LNWCCSVALSSLSSNLSSLSSSFAWLSLNSLQTATIQAYLLIRYSGNMLWLCYLESQAFYNRLVSIWKNIHKGYRF
jgi:hypothetical protein